MTNVVGSTTVAVVDPTKNVVDTPCGPFTVVVDGDGAVLASGWTTDVDALLRVVHPSLRGAAGGNACPALAAAAAYFDGDLTAIDVVAVRQASGPFLEHAWDVLRRVEPGEAITYAGFAARCGRPGAVRAASAACGRNAAALFVPCHRIVGTDGTLRGFRWGLGVKRRLLAHEARS